MSSATVTLADLRSLVAALEIGFFENDEVFDFYISSVSALPLPEKFHLCVEKGKDFFWTNTVPKQIYCPRVVGFTAKVEVGRLKKFVDKFEFVSGHYKLHCEIQNDKGNPVLVFVPQTDPPTYLLLM